MRKKQRKKTNVQRKQKQNHIYVMKTKTIEKYIKRYKKKKQDIQQEGKEKNLQDKNEQEI